MNNFNPNTSDYYTFSGSHTHEMIGSTEISKSREHFHNHRFAAISGTPVLCNGNHFHPITFCADTHDNHFHEYYGNSSLAIPTGDGRHIHFVNGSTTNEDGHTHEFRFTTLINNPTDSCF